MPDHPTATLATPYGDVYVTLQNADTVYVIDDAQKGRGIRGGLEIRGRAAYCNVHYFHVPGHGWTHEGPADLESKHPGNPLGRTFGYAWQGPKWLDNAGMGHDVTGPAAVRKFHETIAAIVAAWATDSRRESARRAAAADNAADLRATATRLRTAADLLETLAAADTPPGGFSYPTDLRRLEDDAIAAYAAATYSNVTAAV